MAPAHEIDIKESTLRRRGDLLDILLIQRTTGKNIIWATDSYETMGEEFAADKQIETSLITGQCGELIQPRAAKPIAEQKQRTRDKAEVFTPLKIVDRINKLIDWSGDTKYPADENWQEYVSKTILEITCGEAPFIVTRYNPTSHTGKLLKLSNRVGFLDRKLRVVSNHCNTSREWLKWAKQAYQASYGYEWQGDNLLIARENLLYTLIDYYEDKFDRKPSLNVLRSFANIISWNIFQMDGLKYVIPMSCYFEKKVAPSNISLFNEDPDISQIHECEGCKLNLPTRHNGKYVKIMDWSAGEKIRYVDLIANDLGLFSHGG